MFLRCFFIIITSYLEVVSSFFYIFFLQFDVDFTLDSGAEGFTVDTILEEYNFVETVGHRY